MLKASHKKRFLGSRLGFGLTLVLPLPAREGRLQLADPIRKYVPRMPACTDAITVRHLIHETSGLRDYLTLQAPLGMNDTRFYDDHNALRNRRHWLQPARDVFAGPTTLRFQRDEQGRVRGLQMDAGRVRSLGFEKR